MLHFQRRPTLSDDSDNEDEAFKNSPTLENPHRDVLDAGLAASTLAQITSQLDPVYVAVLGGIINLGVLQ